MLAAIQAAIRPATLRSKIFSYQQLPFNLAAKQLCGDNPRQFIMDHKRCDNGVWADVTKASHSLANMVEYFDAK